MLVVIASGAIPVTDPFLIDRVVSIAESRNCEPVICINKCDLDAAETLYQTYLAAGFTTLRVSAETGEGIDRLREVVAGKSVPLPGTPGWASPASSMRWSLISAWRPARSVKLGRGRHTTRHVELFRLSNGAVVGGTPPASPPLIPSYTNWWRPEELPGTFREFRPYLDQCRFQGCAHIKEKGCAVRQAVREGRIAPSRHASYVRLYEQAREVPEWKRK